MWILIGFVVLFSFTMLLFSFLGLYKKEGAKPLANETLFEKNFRNKIIYWNNETVDNIYFAFKAFFFLDTILGRKNTNRLCFEGKNFIPFIKKNFDYAEGGYAQCSKSYATLYTTRLVASLCRHFKDCNGKGSIDNNIIGREERDKIKHFVLQKCKKEISPIEIGFSDTPYKEPDLLSTYIAAKILEGMGWLNEDLISAIKNFVIKNLHEYGDYAGFVDVDGEARSCTTYFGLKTLKICYDNYPGVMEKKWDKFIEDIKPKIRNFIKKCWNEETGGFSTSPHISRPTIPHTKLSIQLVKDILGEKLDYLEIPHIKKKLIKYLESCEEDGGFALERQYQKNLMATSEAVMIIKYLSDEDKNFKRFLEVREDKIRAFIKSCEGKESYRGYALA